MLVTLFLLALGLLLLGGALVAYGSIARDLPAPDELRARVSHYSSTLIYDRAGGLLNEIGDPNYGRRTEVSLDSVSPHLIHATIATEDPNFYQHPGVDPVGLARMLYYAVRNRDLSGPGGSTITQQLVKLTFLSSERTIERKVKEAILAAEITRRYSKEDILQIYLNEIYYGNLAYGIEAAAETYFGKRAGELTLGEAALLAGLPQAPAYYDPYTKLWNADGTPGPVKRRQGVVLRLMVENEYITPAQADAAWAEPLRLKPLQQTYRSPNPHFAQYVRDQVEQVLGPELLSKGGLRIYTTLDPQIQAIAQEEVSKQVKALASQGATNGALIAIQPKTGEILAMVGSADFYNEQISGQINMALVPRQPGSAIKPFTYLAAFEMPAASLNEKDGKPDPDVSAIEPPGYWTPATAIMDIRTEFPDGANPPYVPTNYDEKEHGLVTVRSALANSYNIPAVKALEHAGLERLKQVAARAGITTLTRPDYGLSLTLGGGEVTLLELTGAYAVLANGGTRVRPGAVACVLDANNRLLWRGNGAEAIQACASATATSGRVLTPVPSQAALNPQHVYLITSILSDLEARRPMFGRNAELLSLPDRPSAAKTGTTNDYRDAWTLGYTPDLTVGVWIGNADYKPMQKVAGGIGAAPIWHNVMQRSLQGKPAQKFVEPPGIQRIRVCADTGTLPSEACPSQRIELFAANQPPLPARYDLHQRVSVDKVTGKLATQFTPPERVEVRDVMIFPARYRAWAEAHGILQLADELSYAFPPELTLREPANGAQLQGLVPIVGRAHVPEPLVWRVEYGVGPNPIGWGVVAGPSRGDWDGVMATWDTGKPVEAHGVYDFSLRLAAYDPANFDYPVAVSNAVYVLVVPPTVTPTRTPTASPTASSTPTPLPSPTATAALATWTPVVSPTAAEPTATPPASSQTPIPAPTSTARPSPTAGVPTDTPEPALQAAIVQPRDRSSVTGRVQVIGTAAGSAFAGYILEFAPGDRPTEESWQPVALPQATPVRDGLLGIWNTNPLRPGLYTLRLTVFAGDRTRTATTVRVSVGG